MVPPMKNFGGNKMFAVFDFYYVTLTDDDDIDNLNLSSPYHYPAGKNSTLLSGSHWRPKKKNYWSFWSPRISTQVRPIGSKRLRH
jgi:hypothetical protein